MRSGAYATSALHWLEIAAEGGDLEAMVDYALHADPRFQAREKSDLLSPGVIENSVDGKAMRYLVLAAEGGVEDAFFLLADAYEVGRFGEKDIVKSYAYRLTLHALDPTENIAQLVKQKSVLVNTYERQQAVRMAEVLEAGVISKRQERNS